MGVDQKSSLSGWVLVIVRTLEEVGIDTEALLHELGMDPGRLNYLDSRFDQELITMLWQKSEELTGDPHLGLKAAKHMRPANLHVVGHAMSCSGSLKQALQRFIRFRHLIADSALMDLVEVDDSYQFKLEIETSGKPAAHQAYDVCLASIVMLFRWIMDDNNIAPNQVCFKHASPGDPEHYQTLFQCPVVFDQPCTLMSLPRSVMELQIPTANEEVAVLLDDLAVQYLSQCQSGKFAQQIRSTLITLLPKGEPTKAAVAEILGLSNRTLLRRLQEENTTYQEVLDRVREEMAYGYLKRADMMLEEIAYLLGFSDVSAYSRAFKRWSGKSPGQWRSQLSEGLGADNKGLQK